jgi:polyhydroxyalkanoate synthesis regulator phasin
MIKLQESLDRSLAMAQSLNKNIWDMCMIGMGNATWTQEQLDKQVQDYFLQKQQMRNEARKYFDETLKQGQKSQEKVHNMLQETVNIAFKNTEYPGFKYMEELNSNWQKICHKMFGQDAEV